MVPTAQHDYGRGDTGVTHGTSGSNGAGLRILVVGAGIAGLGAARALRQRGFAADVIEREPAWTHTGAGIYLLGNASRALHALGLESAVAERASPISHHASVTTGPACWPTST